MGYENISPKEVLEIMASNKDAVILDVRREEEFEEGHIKGAIWLPGRNLMSDAEDMIPDYDQPIFVYCNTGIRSERAVVTLKAMGYTNLTNLGSIKDWPYELVSE